MGNTVNYYLHPEITPNDKTPIEFDPLIGFPQGARKKKEFKVTAAEIESAQVPDEYIDYCLHKQLAFIGCKDEKFPFLSLCQPLFHEYQTCMFEEYKDRLRDYERDRRLMMRRQRRIERERKKQQELLNTV